METLHSLKSTEPPLWLAPSPTLSDTARKGSQHLFSCLKPHVPRSPFDQLLVYGFDDEQIWQQIDLLSQPLLSNLRRHVKHFEKHPEQIKLVLENKDNEISQGEKKAPEEKKREKLDEFDEYDLDMDEFDDEDEDDDEEEEGGKRGSEEGESEDEDEEMREEKGEGGIEDKFLKIKELEEFLEEDEAREYGLDGKKKGEQKNLNELDEEEEEEDDDGDCIFSFWEFSV